MMRYIVVGLGNIGRKRIGTLGSRYVASVDPFNAEADYRLIDDVPTQEYDAAILSVPNAAKADLVCRLVAAGKHVLVEKPFLFSDGESARKLARIADANNAVWYTSYNLRFEPLILRARHLLENGTLGSLYHARALYGNGTVRNCIGTWRETGYGVLEDLGSHLVDLAGFLFGYDESGFLLWEASTLESKVLDHCVFASPDRRLVLECGTTFWKNDFKIDVYCEMGSLHLSGLCKWGPCQLVVRKRVYPSGEPEETTETVQMADPTWTLDIAEFEERVKLKDSSWANDLRISESLRTMALQLEIH